MCVSGFKTAPPRSHSSRNMTALAYSPAAVSASCSLHPDRQATLTCSRCGAFICDEDKRQLGANSFCPTCAARPDVDYLEAFRLSVWGKRDGWAWLVGFGALLNGLGAVSALASGSPLYAVSGLIAAVVGACYFLGLKWARVALLLVPLVVGAVNLVSLPAAPALTALEAGRRSGLVLGSLFIPMLVLAAMYFDTRNRLFFKIQVPREKLQKAWDIRHNNPVARSGFMVSVLALIMPGLGLLSLPMCIVGLKRVNPDGHPPIGRRGQAIGGIVLSVVSLAGWTLVFVVSAR